MTNLINEKTLKNDIKHIQNVLSNNVKDLKTNIGKYQNLGMYTYINISNLGDIEKNIELEKIGLKVKAFKVNPDKPNKKPIYKFIHGFSPDIFSCINGIGKYSLSIVNEDLQKKFNVKNGYEFVEKFFIRNEYLSIKNGYTNLKKSYDLKELENNTFEIIVKEKAKKVKKANSKNEDNDNDNENYLTFKFVDNLVNNESYSKLNAIQIKEAINQFTNKLLEDNDYSMTKFKDEISSLNLPKIKQVK